jgi:hypothetical protein
VSRYSKTPLFKKLGIKEGMEILIVHKPNNYEKLVGSILKFTNKYYQIEEKRTYDFIQLFTRSQEELQELFPKLKQNLKQKSMLWISWPKGSCGVGVTDLNENLVRDIGLQNGLVDVKIASIDDMWSGLKFVYRVKDRK